MSLKDTISNEIKLAMKAKDKLRLETVRSIKKVILEKETDVRVKGQEGLTPDEEMDILVQQAKQRRDSIEQYQKAGRDELAEKEAQELTIIESFLPKQLTDEELSAVLDELIAESGASSPKEMGKVMGVAMKQLKGKADGKKVQDLVKAKLSALS
ncbi:MAG: GatB/YqeY domain-containing protein [Leptolyngbyaceae bacterium]|nr:GatB/YqeY domain-containing protein [Leptolyngbyaceae bacterium]